MKFVLKWIANGLVVVLLLMYFADVSFWSAFVTATVLTIIAYILGDQLILRKTNNIIATLSDAVLAFVVLWAAAVWMGWDLSISEAIIMSVVLGIVEWFIHRYVFNYEAKLATGEEK